MAFIDFILGGLLLYGLVKGFWKGLFTELASLLSLILGIYIAVKFSGFAGTILEGHVSWNPRYISIAAFAVTFIAVVAAIIVLGKVFTKLASFASLGIVNRLLGGVFGCLKMVLIVSVSLNFFLKINSSNTFAEKETLDNSMFFYPLLKVSETIFPVLEDWFKEFNQKDEEAAV
ncbi:MAG: CvpA family protein [Flavobacterium sp.]|nr:MAG: CvpA family protein [Flavobacterium sp.]